MLRHEGNKGAAQDLPHDFSRTEVEVLRHNVQQLLLALLGGPVVEDGHGERVGHADSIGDLKPSSES